MLSTCSNNISFTRSSIENEARQLALNGDSVSEITINVSKTIILKYKDAVNNIINNYRHHLCLPLPPNMLFLCIVVIVSSLSRHCIFRHQNQNYLVKWCHWFSIDWLYYCEYRLIISFYYEFSVNGWGLPFRWPICRLIWHGRWRDIWYDDGWRVKLSES